GLAVTISERLPQVLQADLAVATVDAVDHPGQPVGEGVGSLDGEGLADRHDQANRHVDEPMDGAMRSPLQRTVAPWPDRTERPLRACARRAASMANHGQRSRRRPRSSPIEKSGLRGAEE